MPADGDATVVGNSQIGDDDAEDLALMEDHCKPVPARSGLHRVDLSFQFSRVTMWLAATAVVLLLVLILLVVGSHWNSRYLFSR